LKKGVISMGRQVLLSVAAAVMMLTLSGCSTFSGPSTSPPRNIKLLDLPPETRAAVDRLMTGGIVNRVHLAKENGTEFYDVEGTLYGKQVEHKITATGKILSSRESMSYESLPAAVRMASTMYFGTAEQLPAFKETTDDKTFYIVHGRKDGAPVTLKLSQDAKVVSEEKK
jgi:hypothetical protein